MDQAEAAKTALDVALIDAEAIVGALKVRSLRPGDRIVPFGMHESKKLQDVFVDKKLPQPERARAAVVVDDEKVLWVVGVIVSEAARVTPETRRAVRLTTEVDH
jgi:tRNA(Ile)-lysidine synthase